MLYANAQDLPSLSLPLPLSLSLSLSLSSPPLFSMDLSPSCYHCGVLQFGIECVCVTVQVDVMI